MNTMLNVVAIFAFIFGAVALVIVFCLISRSKDNISKKSLGDFEIRLLESMVASLNEVKNAIPQSFPNFDSLNSSVNLAKEELKQFINTAVEAEKTARLTSEDDILRELKSHANDGIANGVKKIVEDLQKDFNGKILAINAAVTKVEKDLEDLKGNIADGDKKTYANVATLLDKEAQKFDELIEDLKGEQTKKFDSLRISMGHLYPVEILARDLAISPEIAQKLIDLGFESVEKITEMEALDFALNLTGFELKDAIYINKRAKEIFSARETPDTGESEIKNLAQKLVQKLDGAMGEKETEK